jgi:hypothetical protein
LGCEGSNEWFLEGPEGAAGDLGEGFEVEDLDAFMCGECDFGGKGTIEVEE